MATDLSEAGSARRRHFLASLFSRRNLLAWVVLAVTLLTQGIVLRHQYLREERAAERQFGYLADSVTEAIGQRMRNHEAILLGAAGLFEAAGEVTRWDWRDYVDRLELDARFPGIQGVGFAPLVRKSRLAEHQAAVRDQGFPDYAVYPTGDRPLYAPVAYLEPFSGRNLAAFGFDMLSEPVRREAMMNAGATGETRMTGKVTLQQETAESVQAGVLLYVPIYRADADLGEADERLAALRGFVYSPFRMSDLMQGIIGTHMPAADLTLYAGAQEDPWQRLYSSRDREQNEHSPRYSLSRNLALHGQVWTLRLDSLPRFEAGFHASEPALLALGLSLSGLLFLLISTLSLRNERAKALAARMTERIQLSRRALRLSEERLALALKGSNDGLWDLNLEAGTLYASPRTWALLGYAPGELIAHLRLWEELLEPGALESARTALEQTLRSDRSHFTAQLPMRHKQGHAVPVLMRGYVQRDAEGRALRLTGTMMDLTEHKRVERLKDEFVSTVSHELRTPLTSICGALGLVNGGVLGEVPSAMQELLNIAQQNSERLTHLINDLLDMDKIAAGRMAFELQSVPLVPQLEQALQANRAFAEQHRVRCRLVGQRGDTQVQVDPHRLQQALTNLLSNAIKYSPAEETVELGWRLCGARARIWVRDKGPGIPDHFQARIFQRFAQADASDRRERGGTGLGLAITRELVEHMGGAVGFRSTENEGATFWLELPLAADAAPVQPADNSRPRLLVVEDDPDIGRVLHLLLTTEGYDVERASSLHQARQRLASGDHYAAMTLDLHLPDGQGAALIDDARAQPATQQLPIVVLSAAGGDLAPHHAQDRLLVRLDKPIHERALLNALRELCGAREQGEPR